MKFRKKYMLSIIFIGCSLSGKMYSKNDSFNKTQIGDNVKIQLKDERTINIIVRDIRNDSIFGDSTSFDFEEINDISKIADNGSNSGKIIGFGVGSLVIVYGIAAVGVSLIFISLILKVFTGKT